MKTYGIEYRNMHTAIHGILVFANKKDAMNAYKNLQTLENVSSQERYDDILNTVFNICDRDFDLAEINYRDVVENSPYNYYQCDDTKIIIVNQLFFDLYI